MIKLSLKNLILIYVINFILFVDSYTDSNQSEKSLCTLLKQKYKSQFTQTVDLKRRQTFINPIQEVSEVKVVPVNSVPYEAGYKIMINEEVCDPLADMVKDKYTDKIQRLRIMSDSAGDDNFLDHQNSMDFFLYKKRFSRKRANSLVKKSVLAKAKNTDKDVVISKVIEDNRILEEKIEKMHEFSKENEELRNELSTAKNKLTEKEINVINEKDKKIEELAKTLTERENMHKKLLRDFNDLKEKINKEPFKENKFQRLVEEKEEQLEKINHMNASYRAQLIELKISMSKTRDARRISLDDQYAVKIDNPKTQLEEAKEILAYKDQKIVEQNSIIETLLAQAEYYKNKYGE